jgi:hypothetical protein
MTKNKSKIAPSASARSLAIGKSVFIEWEDSCCASGWKDESQLADLDASGCVSVGWIVRKTATSLTLAPHVGVNHGVVLRQTNGHMMIPLSAIRCVKILSLPNLNAVVCRDRNQ